MPSLTGAWWRASGYRVREDVIEAQTVDVPGHGVVRTPEQRRVYIEPTSAPQARTMGWERPQAVTEAARRLAAAADELVADGVPWGVHGGAARKVADALLPWVNDYGLPGIALVDVVAAEVGRDRFRATPGGWAREHGGAGHGVVLRDGERVSLDAGVFHGASWADFLPRGAALPLSDEWWSQYREPAAALYRAALELRGIRNAFVERKAEVDHRRARRLEGAAARRQPSPEEQIEAERLCMRAERIVSARHSVVVERSGRLRFVDAFGTLFEALVAATVADAIDDDSPHRICACGKPVTCKPGVRGHKLPDAHRRCRVREEKKTKARAASRARALLEAGLSERDVRAQLAADYPAMALDRVMRAARAHKLKREGKSYEQIAHALRLAPKRGAAGEVAGAEQVRRLLSGLLGVGS